MLLPLCFVVTSTYQYVKNMTQLMGNVLPGTEMKISQYDAMRFVFCVCFALLLHLKEGRAYLFQHIQNNKDYIIG